MPAPVIASDPFIASMGAAETPAQMAANAGGATTGQGSAAPVSSNGGGAGSLTGGVYRGEGGTDLYNATTGQKLSGSDLQNALSAANYNLDRIATAKAGSTPNTNTNTPAPTLNTSGGVIQGSAPAGSQLSANGNWVDSSGRQFSMAPGTGQSAVLTANIAPPSTTTSAAPAAVSSNSAKSDLATKTATASELAANASAQTAAKSASGTTAPVTTSTTGNNNNNSTPDATIASILSSLDSNLATIQSNANTQSNAIDKAIVDTQAQADAAAHAAYAKLDSINNGTYPLSPTEQSLLDATKASYAGALQGQAFANAGALGQMQETLASLGIEKTAPLEAVGLIQNVISTGALKLADISSKMATAVGNLQVKLQQQDFNNIQSAWKDMAAQFTARTNALQKLQTDVSTAAKDAQTAATNYTKEAVTAIVDSQKATETQKKDAATAAYQNGTLSARQYADVTARIKALQPKALTVTEQKQAALDNMNNWVVSGKSPYKDTPILDTHGNITPKALQYFLNSAPSHNLTAADVLGSLSRYIYAPNGVVDPSYGLNAAELKLVTPG